MSTVIHLSKVCYRYHTEDSHLTLQDINLEIPAGGITAFIGTTGSGKSTLLQLIAAILLPTEGQAEVAGISLHRKGLKEKDLDILRQKAVMAMQRPEDMLFKTYVGDDVAFGPSNYGLEGQELALRVKSAMETAGLPYGEYKDRQALSLSGGERRKAALAGVLALDPDILILDEPAAGLDPAAADSLMQLIQTLKKRGKTVLFSTHNMNHTLKADMVVMLSRGRIIATAPPRKLFLQQELLEEASILPPDIFQLRNLLLKQGISLEGFDAGMNADQMGKLIFDAVQPGRSLS